MTTIPNRNRLTVSAHELADWVQAKLPAIARDAQIKGFASLNDAREGELSFFSHERYRPQLAATRASFVLVPLNWKDLPPGMVGLQVENPSNAFDRVIQKFGVASPGTRRGIHRTAVLEDGAYVYPGNIAVGANAVVESGVLLGDGVEIGPGCFVGQGVRIGKGSRLFANVTVHEGCILGRNVILHSGVVIGADGFGYEFVAGRHRKIKQTGIVQIDDEVEIGANTTVDRARFGRTWIGEGTKIDNQVQVGHNVVIGKHCIVVAGAGLAGSAILGDYVVMAAESGVAGHVTVGSKCVIGGRAGVTKNVAAGSGTYLGFPAAPAGEERRRIAAVRKLPELLTRVRKLEALAAETLDQKTLPR